MKEPMIDYSNMEVSSLNEDGPDVKGTFRIENTGTLSDLQFHLRRNPDKRAGYDLFIEDFSIVGVTIPHNGQPPQLICKPEDWEVR